MTETLELSYPVSEDEARDFLRKTSAPERYQGDSGEAQLKADLEQTMGAIRSRVQWLQGLDPLTRMEAERQPILTGLVFDSTESETPSAPEQPPTAPESSPQNTGGTGGTEAPNQGQGQPTNQPPQPGSTGL